MSKLIDFKDMSAFLAPAKQWKNIVSATLTTKKCVKFGIHTTWGTPVHYSGALKHTLNVLNKNLNGRKWRRLDQKIKVIAVLEQDQSARYHYHLALDRPDGVDMIEFSMMLTAAWRNTHWGNRECDVDHANGGWIDYIAKRRSKVEYDLAFDLSNCHL